jgi:undecaprenyl diphosphate synthase
MDGNGRWAKRRLLPRVVGHRVGANILRDVIEQVARLNIPFLTVFAFSSENWKRPKEEVDFLMKLFYDMLDKEANNFMEQKIRLIVAGDTSVFSEPLKNKISEVEQLTQHNQQLCLTIAANYGGRWDIIQATQRLVEKIAENPKTVISENNFSSFLSLAHAPDPDLMIRTGGDFRISNFLLWQMAYTELFFLDKNWPEFTKKDLLDVVNSFKKRERRFGSVLTEPDIDSTVPLIERMPLC